MYRADMAKEMENENGYLVWNVILEFERNQYEIIVDAGNGSILWTSSEK